MRIVAIILLAIFYLLFSFDFNVGVFPGKTLFANDFGKEGVADWLAYEVITYSFLIYIGTLGYEHIEDAFVKRIFLAVVIDGIISISRFIIFGYYEPEFMRWACNAVPYSYVIYAYFAYNRRN